MVNGRRIVGVRGGQATARAVRGRATRAEQNRKARLAEQRKRNQARLKRSQRRIRAGTSNINEVFNPLV